MNPSQEGAFEIYEEAADNYTAMEVITSAYIRYDQKLWNDLDLIVGLRMEHTALNYSGYNWVVDDLDNEQGYLEPTGETKNDYINLLPSVLLKYNATEDLKLRASFTKTLSRPKYSALIPCVHYNIAEEEASFGNANLKPTTSYNLDLGGEYYFKSVGLVSVGLFYKNIKDVIAEEKWKSTNDPNIPSGLLNEDGDPVKYEISKPINAYDADLFGVELALQ